jgi:hypothetical protein
LSASSELTWRAKAGNLKAGGLQHHHWCPARWSGGLGFWSLVSHPSYFPVVVVLASFGGGRIFCNDLHCFMIDPALLFATKQNTCLLFCRLGSLFSGSLAYAQQTCILLTGLTNSGHASLQKLASR